MWNSNEWENRFADRLDLSGEPMPGLSIAELAGDCRVLVERHGGIIEYGSTKIRVSVNYGQLCVQGCNLELISMTKSQLIIGGEIDSMTVIRRK